MNVNILGYIASLLTMTCFIPQIIKAIKTKSVEDVSLITLIQLEVGISLWIVYALFKQDYPLITNNVISLLCVIIMNVCYCRYKQPKFTYKYLKAMADKIAKGDYL
jgi:MtN3 and saliva related transmembrane protein